MNINNTKDVTIYDFTVEVQNKVKEIYTTKEMQEKALLLVYLINRADGLGYQVNVRNHRAFYGNLNGVKWNELFQPLITNNLIFRTSSHEVGNKSKTYTTTKQYKWKPNTGEIKRRFYGEEFKLMPEYIQKFHLDNHLVVNPSKSLWSDNYHYVSKEIMTDDERETMQDLKNNMFFMKEAIELMQIEINRLNKKVEALENVISNDEVNTIAIEEVKEDLPTIEEFEVIETPSDVESVESKAFFNDDEDDNFGFIFPNEQEQQIIAEPVNVTSTPVDDFDSFLITKLKSARVQPVYWQNAIQYIKEKKHEVNPIELGKLISISTGSTQVIIKKIQQYWN